MKKKIIKIITIILVIGILIYPTIFVLDEISDLSAYKDTKITDENIWKPIIEKIDGSGVSKLDNEDYHNIFLQTGLGKPAVDKLIVTGNKESLNTYRNYYIKDKDFECVRTGLIARHEQITDADKNPISNPKFADLQNGDIVITLSIHSLGWRHGHAAMVVDAPNGTLLQAQMLGEKSNLSNISEWSRFPRVAVLRPKNVDPIRLNEIAQFAKENFVGLDYSFFADYENKMIDEEKKIPKTTHCANLIKEVYALYDIDVDSNGGKIVTPNEIFECENLEIVQVYGNMNRNV